VNEIYKNYFLIFNFLAFKVHLKNTAKNAEKFVVNTNLRLRDKIFFVPIGV